ncbi:YciI family protein [Nodularia spumigena]|uniref:YciI family protein n=1 Tax=Nodularia spumigena TaxID=70799 RepID=UPI002B1EFD34|nr:hypothetical protein [Nodularia spumigena]MEA5611804.1 hypothetical protein [Nodularia spumigena UHCC 0040]
MTVRLLTVLFALMLPLLPACGTVPDRGEVDRAWEGRTVRDYVFVFIRTGPLRTPTPEQSQEAMQGHFANMGRLADEGKLLIAGPYADPRPTPDHRGLFVMDETEVALGLELANTDPAAVMGVFVMSAHRFTTDRPLTDLPRLEKEDEARRLADPAVPDEWQGRRYVLATAPYSDALLAAARKAEGVLIAGRLHGAGDGGGHQVLVWVDAEGVEAADGMLPEGDWGVWGWYGSGMVAGMGE